MRIRTLKLIQSRGV